jgi:uncharacterized integral membrane protein
MIRRLISVLITIPLAVILIALAVANRSPVPVRLDVFNPQNPALTVNAPLFVWILLAVAIGVIAGGIGAWFAQGTHRKMERKYRSEAKKLRFEVEDTKRAAGTDQPTGKSLVLSR